MLLLAEVRWEAIPHGETIKLGVALVLVLVGYLMYRTPAVRILPASRRER